jgi:hypothetical protein
MKKEIHLNQNTKRYIITLLRKILIQILLSRYPKTSNWPQAQTERYRAKVV